MAPNAIAPSTVSSPDRLHATLDLADTGGVRSDTIRNLMASTNTSETRSASVVGAAPPGNYSVADALFMLHVARKEAVDDSLDVALKGMQGKLEQQKAINTVIRELGNVGGATTGGLVTFTPAQVKTLQDAGFAFPDAEHTRADGAIQRNPADGTYFIPAGKLDAAKKELTEFVTTLSSTNEIEMLTIQRLMNQANEASQAASALLKSGHDIAMSIIRNIA